MDTWEDLEYWKTGEWQAAEERLDDLDKAGVLYNPARQDLFAAMDAVDYKEVTVAVMAQDPYPDRRYATGVAFSIPKAEKTFPSTLRNLFKEYQEDLHWPLPSSGNLKSWTEQGVFLWNVIPTCLLGRPLSHDWPEWSLLTREIVEKLSERGIVFVLLGGRARSFVKYIDLDTNDVIEAAHPVPKASLMANKPFNGSRIFSTVNSRLVKRGLEPINWRL